MKLPVCHTESQEMDFMERFSEIFKNTRELCQRIEEVNDQCRKLEEFLRAPNRKVQEILEFIENMQACVDSMISTLDTLKFLVRRIGCMYYFLKLKIRKGSPVLTCMVVVVLGDSRGECRYRMSTLITLITVSHLDQIFRQAFYSKDTRNRTRLSLRWPQDTYFIFICFLPVWQKHF